MSLPADFIQPMLAKLSGSLPADDTDWGYELKWDGVRLLAYVEHGHVRLLTRNALDATDRYPPLAGLGRQFTGEAIFDGEVIAFDAEGRPDFQSLQQRAGPPSYMIFDVLWLNGRSCQAETYRARRQILQDLTLTGDNWATPDWVAGNGQAMFEASAAMRLEGIVAKRLDSPYEAGKRTGAWLKIKHHQRQEFVIGGWLMGLGKRANRVGALLIGYYRDGQLIYAGKVGTGFNDQSLDELDRLLSARVRSDNPFEGRPPQQSRFVRPDLVCEVEFTEWTSNGQIRHPSFKGLRTDKQSSQVVREG